MSEAITTKTRQPRRYDSVMQGFERWSDTKGKMLYYWHMKAVNGRIVFTGGEDLTAANRDKAMQRVLDNWIGTVLVRGMHDGAGGIRPAFIHQGATSR